MVSHIIPRAVFKDGPLQDIEAFLVFDGEVCGLGVEHDGTHRLAVLLLDGIVHCRVAVIVLQGTTTHSFT